MGEYQKGDRVKVVKQGAVTYGKVGTVQAEAAYQVRLDGESKDRTYAESSLDPYAPAPPPPPPPTGKPTLKLSADGTAGEIDTVPTGTQRVLWARSVDATGDQTVYDPLGVRALTGARTFAGTVEYPYVSVCAIPSSGDGVWSDRLKTTQAAAPPPPDPDPQPTPDPTPAGQTIIGVNPPGNWGGIPKMLKDRGVLYYRSEATQPWLSEAASVGLKPAMIFLGEGGSIGGIDPQQHASQLIAACKKYGALAAEVLNEPGGSWFWSDPGNVQAYVQILQAVFNAAKGTGIKTLASWDGGAQNPNFGRGWKALGGLNYCDGVTTHPYGGASGQYGGMQGNRDLCVQAAQESGKPVWITEIGWPTGSGSTGDSQGVSENQQAANVKDFAVWAKAEGHVAAVMFYNLISGNSGLGSQYGVWRFDLSEKPAGVELRNAAK